MATLALAAIGSAVGNAALPAGISTAFGHISGAALGQAIGASLGGLVDQALFAPRPPDTEGPRLETGSLASFDEGAAVQRIYGLHRPGCSPIWTTRFREVATEEEVGGKGGMMGGGQAHTSYAYFVSFAVVVGEPRVTRIKQIFLDNQDIGDLLQTPHAHGTVIEAVDGTVKATFYDGSQTEPDALILAVEGEAPAYHGLSYLVFDEFPLANYGNRAPTVSVEAERDLPAPTTRGMMELIAADYGVLVDLEAAPEEAETLGYLVDRPISARAALEGVMGLHQLTGAFDADGVFRITPMQGAPALVIDEGDLVAPDDEGGSPLTISTAGDGGVARRIVLNYPDTGRDYQQAQVSAQRRLPGADGETSISTTFAMPRNMAAARAFEALATAALGRETVSGVLMPSLAARLGPADFLGVTTRCGRRIDLRLTRLAWEMRGPFEGVVTAQTPPSVAVAGGGGVISDPVSGYGPVDLVFLDLPLLRGDEQPHAPHVAAWAAPWAGASVYRATPGGAYALSAFLSRRATLGELAAPLPAPAAPWVWAEGAELLVDLRSGALSSATPEAVEAGANAAALEWPGGWEILQWRSAELVSPGRWRLTNLRRGMRGTEFLIGGDAPTGARFVLLNSAVVQADLAPTMRGVSQDWLWGPSNRPRDHASYQGATQAFAGAGLRPYAPTALAGALIAEPGPPAAENLLLTWTRRSRGEPDIWTAPEPPPLKEEREEYRVEIRSAGGALLRTATVSAPAYLYAAAEMAADGAASPLTVAVRQISAVYGPGAPARAVLTL